MRSVVRVCGVVVRDLGHDDVLGLEDADDVCCHFRGAVVPARFVSSVVLGLEVLDVVPRDLHGVVEGHWGRLHDDDALRRGAVDRARPAVLVAVGCGGEVAILESVERALGACEEREVVFGDFECFGAGDLDHDVDGAVVAVSLGHDTIHFLCVLTHEGGDGAHDLVVSLGGGRCTMQHVTERGVGYGEVMDVGTREGRPQFVVAWVPGDACGRWIGKARRRRMIIKL
mmetsp:Transcript_4250/g.12292  ORF Transcript_4250/g.12292 Transcript_4250/m.12292 type:complete len:228 (-) Transcript_4250:9-692(-)